MAATRRTVPDPNALQIRFSRRGDVVMVWEDGAPIRTPTQTDMDTLPVGRDMSADEVEQLDT